MDEANGLLFNPHSLQTLMYPPAKDAPGAPTNGHVGRHKNTKVSQRGFCETQPEIMEANSVPPCPPETFGAPGAQGR